MHGFLTNQDAVMIMGIITSNLHTSWLIDIY